MAKLYDLECKYRWTGDGYEVFVDGSLLSLQLLARRIEQTLPALAWQRRTDIPAGVRATIVARVCMGCQEAVQDISQFVDDVASQLKGVSGGIHYSLGDATDLRGRLNDFANAVYLYDTGYLGPSQMAEELHSVAELLMKRVTGSWRASFASLVEQCKNDGIIASAVASKLIELKDIRKAAKHLGQGVGHERLRPVVAPTLTATKNLVGRLAQRTDA